MCLATNRILALLNHAQNPLRYSHVVSLAGQALNTRTQHDQVVIVPE
jgi:hypothetical protein